MARVGITGMGIISAIGDNVQENWLSLKAGKTGIKRIKHLPTQHANEIFVGEIDKTNIQLVNHLNVSTSEPWTRTALLGIWAAREAVAQAGGVEEGRVGLISATSVGGMDTTEKYFLDYPNRPELTPYILTHDPGHSSHVIAEDLGIKGYVTTISTACSSAANAILLGAKLIAAGELDSVVVGGTDALSKFTINGFKTLMILSDEHNTPFDQNRKGLNLGEAAAYLVLESQEMIQRHGKKVLGYVSGYGNANDAYHQTASSENGEGATMAMEKALETAGLNPIEIDYINVHGTATANNDLSEGRALFRIFGENTPDFSSTKPYTGHTLAAAGAIEAVFSLLALQNGWMYPNLNFKQGMEEIPLRPLLDGRSKELKHVLSNSFGFGGNCSTLIFSR